MRKLQVLLAAFFAFLVLAWAAPAFGQEYPPDVEGEEEEVAGDTQGEGGLASTGANVTLFAATGVIAVGAGVFLVSRARARREAVDQA